MVPDPKNGGWKTVWKNSGKNKSGKNKSGKRSQIRKTRGGNKKWRKCVEKSLTIWKIPRIKIGKMS